MLRFGQKVLDLAGVGCVVASSSSKGCTAALHGHARRWWQWSCGGWIGRMIVIVGATNDAEGGVVDKGDVTARFWRRLDDENGGTTSDWRTWWVKTKIGGRKQKIRTLLTNPLSEALNIPAPPEAKLTPPKKDTFFLLLLWTLDTRELYLRTGKVLAPHTSVPRDGSL